MTSPCFLYNFAKENIRIPFNLGSVIKLSNQPKKETTHSISKFQFWSTWKSEDKLSKQKAKDCQVLALWKLYAGWKRMQILQNRLNSITSRRYCKSNQQFLPAIDSFFLNCFIALRFMQVYSTHEKKTWKSSLYTELCESLFVLEPAPPFIDPCAVARYSASIWHWELDVYKTQCRQRS